MFSGTRGFIANFGRFVGEGVKNAVPLFGFGFGGGDENWGFDGFCGGMNGGFAAEIFAGGEGENAVDQIALRTCNDQREGGGIGRTPDD